MKRFLSVCLFCVIGFFILTAEDMGCSDRKKTADMQQQEKQEKIQREGTQQIGLPKIVNFRELRILKDIQELCDQQGIVTYTYLFSEMTGKFTYLGETVGFPIPYSTQLTNPEKVIKFADSKYYYAGTQPSTIPQADPNGLFKPQSSEATWILLKNPKTGDIQPMYMESRVACFRWQLPESMINK